MINRWVVVTYFTFVHPVLLYRRFHNGGMATSTYFWIGMAILVLAMYLPQVLRDLRHGVRLEFEGLVLTVGYLFKPNQIIPVNSIIAIEKRKHSLWLKTDEGNLEITSQLSPSAYKLLDQLFRKFGK